jgi:HAD superfamily hydrolase (TIGR01484 family)
MIPLASARADEFAAVRLVLTDMDDTLTRNGRLAAATYAALERLETAGVHVIPVTAAPAGWCDQMALMWPVTAVIGENGGFAFRRAGASVTRAFWLEDAAREAAMHRLRELGQKLVADFGDVALADDQPFRLASLAFRRPESRERTAALARALADARLSVTVNSIWVLAWSGGYDKLSAARRFLPALAGLDVDRDRDAIVYVGDSGNDAPMFAHFEKSAGVSTVRAHLADIPRPPRWITRGAGGDGFVEVAEAILAARS